MPHRSMRDVNELDIEKGRLKVVSGLCCSAFSPLGKRRWKAGSTLCLVISVCALLGQGVAVCPQPHRGATGCAGSCPGGVWAG